MEHQRVGAVARPLRRQDRADARRRASAPQRGCCRGRSGVAPGARCRHRDHGERSVARRSLAVGVASGHRLNANGLVANHADKADGVGDVAGRHRIKRVPPTRLISQRPKHGRVPCREDQAGRRVTSGEPGCGEETDHDDREGSSQPHNRTVATQRRATSRPVGGARKNRTSDLSIISAAL